MNWLGLEREFFGHKEQETLSFLSEGAGLKAFGVKNYMTAGWGREGNFMVTASWHHASKVNREKTGCMGGGGLKWITLKQSLGL